MNSKDYLNDISEIKDLMSKSSKFLSLTGLSGIYSGIITIMGGAYILWISNYNVENIDLLVNSYKVQIVVTLLTILLLSSLITLLLTKRKSIKNDEKAWSLASKKVVYNFYSILTIAAIYITILFFQKQYNLIIELMLVFYGIAILNGSKYTFKEVRPFGYIQIFLGLTCALLSNYDFWFWIIGFGLTHIAFGSIMHFRYGK